MLTLYAEHLWDSPFVFTVMVALEENAVAIEGGENGGASGETQEISARDDH